MFKKSLCFLAAAVLVAVPGVGFAELTYTYTGNNFTAVAGPSFTTADFVSGFVTFDKEPTAGDSFTATNVVDFEFAAGDLRIAPSVENGVVGTATFKFDSSTSLTEWHIAVGDGDLTTVETFISTTSSGTIFDAAEISAVDWGLVSSEAGVWTPVPEPGTIVLWSVFGIFGLLWYRRRRA